VPKSRAKLRGRLDGEDRSATQAEPQVVRDELFAWIAGWLPARPSTQQLASLDLRSFVRDSAHLGFDAAERLRLLAVHLDDESLVVTGTSLARWEIYKRIYAEARRLSPDDPWILRSMAITALDIAESAERDEAGRDRLWNEAASAAWSACELDDADPQLLYTLGHVLYCAWPSRTEEALVEFERALVLDNADQWANLYRAHCLQDLRRWREAADAYAGVNASAFVGAKAWRVELLREQRAFCLLRAGDRNEALAAFVEVLQRREAAIARGEDSLESPALSEPPVLLVEAAHGELRAELYERVEALIDSFDEWRSFFGAAEDADPPEAG
jgi:hypothetical protein